MIDRSDFSERFDALQFGWPVNIIGAGTIGSAVIQMFGMLGIPNLQLYDLDVVEERNVASQVLYGKQDVGKPKIVAANVWLAARESTAKLHNTFAGEATSLGGVVVVCVDSMSARSAIWKSVQRNAALIPLFFDGRIGGSSWQLFALEPFNPWHAAAYDTHLFSNEEATQEECGNRSTPEVATILAGRITSILRQFATKGVIPANMIWEDTDLLQTQSIKWKDST